MKSFMVQGTSSGAGKTTLVTALCRIFLIKDIVCCTIQISKYVQLCICYVPDFEISRAQAIQAIGARCEITA